jgi:hypothetical protein
MLFGILGILGILRILGFVVGIFLVTLDEEEKSNVTFSSFWASCVTWNRIQQ